jgi:hypothetical protein
LGFETEWAACRLLNIILFGILFYPEDGDDNFMRNPMDFYRSARRYKQMTVYFIVSAARTSSSVILVIILR